MKKKKKYEKPILVRIPVDMKRMVKNVSGGCPYVFSWNGKEYAKENSILPDSENLLRDNKVLSDYYVLRNTPQPRDGYLSFKIKEVAEDISWLESFKLITVETDADYNIGFSPQGELLSYRQPRLPLSCRDTKNTDFLSSVSHTNWLTPKGFYESQPGDGLELDFGEINDKNAKLVIVDPRDAYARICDCVEEKFSIHIYLFIDYAYQHISVLHTRAEFYPDIVDLTPHIQQIRGNLKIKLEFTARHKVAFVGIDTTPPVHTERRDYPLIRATHTEFGDVTAILNKDNSESVRLYPGETIELKFPVPQPAKPGNRLSYVLMSKGYYIPIRKLVSLAKAEVVVGER